MRVISMIGHGPAWITGKAVHEQGPSVREHLAAMRARYDEGALLLGGPFERGGGIAVLEVEDERAAQVLMDADPAVQAGVMVYELHRMRAYFDAYAGIRTGRTAAELAQVVQVAQVAGLAEPGVRHDR